MIALRIWWICLMKRIAFYVNITSIVRWSKSIRHEESVKSKRNTRHSNTHTHIVCIQITFHLIECQLHCAGPISIEHQKIKKHSHSTVIIILLYHENIVFVLLLALIGCDFSLHADGLEHLLLEKLSILWPMKWYKLKNLNFFNHKFMYEYNSITKSESFLR